MLSDGSHTYTWDADGNSITVDTVGLTFDAFDRVVEQARGTSYTELVYTPTGVKIALMSGQNLQKALVPLPGQATAVYTSSGLDHYRHSDWIGSARLTSSPARAYISSVAYAPFGETYGSSGTTDPSFTGQNPDTVSTDYDFLFREYSIQGRWSSPDPAGLSAANPALPQSWNRYAYVLGNPLAFTDPLGLCGQVGETPYGDYNYDGGSCLPNYAQYNFWPCFGFVGVWHSGCPKRPKRPQMSNDDKKKKDDARKKACVEKAKSDYSQRIAAAKKSFYKGVVVGTVVTEIIVGVAGCAVGAGVGGALGGIATALGGGEGALPGAAAGCGAGGFTAMGTALPSAAIIGTVAGGFMYLSDYNEGKEQLRKDLETCDSAK